MRIFVDEFELEDDDAQEDIDDSQEDSKDSDHEDRKLTSCFISVCTALSHLFLCHISERENEVVAQSKDDIAQEDIDEFQPKDDVAQDDSHDFRIFEFKAKKCAMASPNVHPGKKASRRDPSKHHYSCSTCLDFGNGDGILECWVYPTSYRTQLCKDGIHCRRRVCFFAHTPEQLRARPYNRRQTILNLFEQMIEWRRTIWPTDKDAVKFNWTHIHLSILYGCLKTQPQLRLQAELGQFLKDRSSYLSRSTIDAWIVAPFARELQEFFVVPKQHQLFERDDHLKQDELMAAFINFLLRLLGPREGSIISLENKIKRLEKVLRFLLTALGDKSLICDEEHEQVQHLLSEIEAVSNEAGNLVHSVVFSTFDDRIFETTAERLALLLKRVDLLEANIIKFSKLQPVITETNVTPKTDAVNSIFIVHSIIYDLEDLLNREDDMISHVKDQIKDLHQKLKLSKSFNKVSRYLEMEELQEHHVMRIRDTAYEAEYLINSFLVGDAPSWYFSIRLSHVIHKIKLVETDIQETKKKYDIDASKLAKNFSAKLSLRNKRSSEVDDIIVGFRARQSIF